VDIFFSPVKEQVMLRSVKAKGLYRSVIVAAALAGGTILAAGARAASISDGNSTVTINPSSNPFISQWIVDGVDQYGGSPSGGEGLFFDVNNSSSFTTPEELTVTNSSFSDGVASVSYQGTGYTITVKEILTGGNSGSGVSAINEAVVVNNTGASALPFDFTDNVNLNLNATPNDDSLSLTSNTADQTDPQGTKAEFTYIPTASSVAASTNGGAGPFTDISLPATFSSGDVAFDYNLSTTIAGGDSAIFSINETVSGAGSSSVPAPNAAASSLVAMLGLGIYAGVRRMRMAAR
jgi:hypothetical protein